MKEKENNSVWLLVVPLVLLYQVVPVVFSIVGYLLLVIFLIFLLGVIVLLIASGIQSLKVRRFLKNNNGGYFFWYSSNKRLKGHIEEKLVPLLEVTFERVYQEREQVHTHLPHEVHNLLFLKTNTLKLPRLIKVVNGKVFATSFYPELMRLKQGIVSETGFKYEVLIKLNNLKDEQT